jgi:hypothetical protein
MALDPTAGRPLSSQLADALRSEIHDRTRSPGSQLPTESSSTRSESLAITGEARDPVRSRTPFRRFLSFTNRNRCQAQTPNAIRKSRTVSVAPSSISCRSMSPRTEASGIHSTLEASVQSVGRPWWVA